VGKWQRAATYGEPQVTADSEAHVNCQDRHPAAKFRGKCKIRPHCQ